MIAELNQSPYQPATVHLASRKYLCPYMSSSIAKSAMSSIHQTLLQSAVDLENDRLRNNPSSLRPDEAVNSRKKPRGDLHAEHSPSYHRHSYLDGDLSSRRERKKDKEEDDDEKESTSMKDNSTPYFTIKKKTEEEKGGVTVRSGAGKNEMEENILAFAGQDKQGSRAGENGGCCTGCGCIKESTEERRRGREKGGEKEEQKEEKARLVMEDIISRDVKTEDGHLSPSLREAISLSTDSLQDSHFSSYRRARSSPAALVPPSSSPSSSFSSCSSSSPFVGPRREEPRLPPVTEEHNASVKTSSCHSVQKSLPSSVKNRVPPRQRSPRFSTDGLFSSSVCFFSSCCDKE